MMENSFKPLIIDDLDYWNMFEYENKNIYCIGSISLDRYIKVENNKDIIFEFSKNLNGQLTISELEEIYCSKKININVMKMIDILCKAGLITNCKNEEKEA